MFSIGENENHIVELLEVKMISLQIYMITEFYFDILRFKDNENILIF